MKKKTMRLPKVSSTSSPSKSSTDLAAAQGPPSFFFWGPDQGFWCPAMNRRNEPAQLMVRLERRQMLNELITRMEDSSYQTCYVITKKNSFVIHTLMNSLISRYPSSMQDFLDCLVRTTKNKYQMMTFHWKLTRQVGVQVRLLERYQEVSRLSFATSEQIHCAGKTAAKIFICTEKNVHIYIYI